jgi:hypothetical protein
LEDRLDSIIFAMEKETERREQGCSLLLFTAL